MKRQYWLSNENGECYYLNNEQGVILYNVKGLGVETGTDYYELGNGFFKPIDNDKRPQTAITGTLMFHKEQPEDEYYRLNDFIQKAAELTFHYAPSTRQYMRRVELNFFTRGGLPLPPVLKVPVSFMPLTPWYTNDVDTYSLGVVGDGFRSMDEADIDASFPEEPLAEDEFDLVLDGGEGLEAEDDRPEQDEEGESRVWDDEDEDCDYLRLTETDILESDIIIDPNGQVESSFSLTFEGSATSPVIYIAGISTGTEYGRVVLNTSFTVNERLEYSTNQLDSYIRKVKNGQSIDLLNAVDISYEIFPRLPTTEPCRIVMASDSEMSGQLQIAVQRYVVGV